MTPPAGRGFIGDIELEWFLCLCPAGESSRWRAAIPAARHPAPGALRRAVCCGDGRRLAVEDPQLSDPPEDQAL